MANVKIGDLNTIADPISTDVLPIVDVDLDVTNKISIEELLKNAADGTAASPAFAFNSDPDTGIYRTGVNGLGLGTAGTGRLFIDSAGNIGAGVAAPSERLDVAGNISLTGTVDGRDVAADGTKLDGIAAGAEVNVDTNLSYTAATRVLASSTGTDATLPEVVASGTSGLMTGADKSKLDGIAAGAQVNVATNLSYTASTRVLASSTGTNATLPEVVASGNSGLITGTDKAKLDGIAAGAEVNVDTNLSYTASTRVLASSTGTNVTLPEVVAAGNSGLMTGADKTKLDGLSPSSGTDLSYTASTRLLESSTGTDVTLPEVVAAGNSGLMTGSDKTKLDGIAAGAEVNVQSDWNAISGDALILNKPTIPAAYTDSSVDTHLNTSTAATNEVLSWNGSDYDWVAQSGGGGGGLFASYAIFTHAATVDGGSINTASSWLTRPLNTTDVSQSWASLSSNQVTLSAGTYLIEWESTVHRVSFNQSRLRNVTDGTTIGAGLLGRANSGDEASWNSSGCAQLVITGSKVIEVQHWVLATKANNGWGDYTNTGENNIYAILKITKHA